MSEVKIEGGNINERAELWQDYKNLIKEIETIDHFVCLREATETIETIKKIREKEVKILGEQSDATHYEQIRIQKLIDAIKEYGPKEG